MVLRPSSTHPVGCLSTGEPFSVRIDSIFFKIFWLLKMYRAFAPGTFFFAVFSKNLAKKFHFIVFFAVIGLSHLMHSVGAIFIMSDSECAPDSFDA